MSEFDSEAFQVKEWINEACRRKPEETELDTYIAQLEMQLQLRCEDVEGEIETTAARLVQQIPSVLMEAEKIESEMTTLHDTLASTVGTLSERSSHAREVVSGINELHQIKANMQSACDSLKEATELSELFVRVDAVFSSGDIFAMAKIMSTMHRSLKLVGNVPEFQSGKEKLKALEENLISSVEAKLSAAILGKQEEQVKRLSEILLSLDQQEVLEKTYVSVKQQEMKGILKSTTDALSDVSGSDLHKRVTESAQEWYGALIRMVSDELEWVCSLFQERGPFLLISALKALLQDWNPCFAAALEKQSSVEQSLSVQETTVDVCLTLKQLLGAVMEAEVMESVMECILEPMEKEIERFAVVERQTLMNAIQHLSASPLSPSQIDSTLQTLLQLTERAIEACLVLTGGTEMPSLAAEMEFCWVTFVSQRTSALRELRSEALPEDAEEPGNVTDVLHLLKAGRTLANNLNHITAQLKQSVTQIESNLMKDTVPLDLVSLRLRRQPEKERALQEFVAKGDWKGEVSVKQAIDGFSAASEALVFDVLMHKPRFLFKAFSENEEWKRVDAGGPGISLPQFNAYPLPYVSAFGEYLMMVPQQLEALVSTETETDDQILDEEEEMASSLLSTVIVGSAELYADEILGLALLTPSGSVQLTCDLQYFSNVLSAMGAAFPQPLASVYDAMQCPLDQLKQRLAVESFDGNARLIFETILKMRDPTSA